LLSAARGGGGGFVLPSDELVVVICEKKQESRPMTILWARAMHSLVEFFYDDLLLLTDGELTDPAMIFGEYFDSNDLERGCHRLSSVFFFYDRQLWQNYA
jgi:hypothetical protein